MNWKFTDDRPIYSQIVELIQKGILSGAYPLGSSMPSVRVLALEASVNPNTMQKALSELESQKLLYTQRTSGRTVTTDEGLIMELKEKIASEYIERYFEGMQSLGIERGAAAGMLASKTGSTGAPSSTPGSTSVNANVNAEKKTTVEISTDSSEVN